MTNGSRDKFTPGPLAAAVLVAGEAADGALNPSGGEKKIAYFLVAFEMPKKLCLVQTEIVSNIQDQEILNGLMAQISMACGGQK